MKIALIQCPLYGTFDPPLGLAQLSACLKTEGHEVSLYDLNIKLYLRRKNEYKNVWAWEQSDFWYKANLVEEYCKKNKEDINDCINQVLKADTQLVGFSVNIASMYMSIHLSKQLKERNRDLTIVFGGPLFLNKKYIDEVLKTGLVDVVVPGEGEYILSALAENRAIGKDISTIPGIALLRDGIVFRNAQAPPVDLDSLPFSDFQSLPFDNYDDPGHVPLLTSRGCIRRCHFCSDAPCWPGYRAMNGERIFKEITYHKNLNPKIGHVDFLDLEFNGRMESLVDFCEFMIKNPMDINWTANMVVRQEMTEDVINKMARAGCEQVILGIESGSERILKLMNKHYAMDDADRIIKQMHEANICVTANFMFGFPGESEEDFQMTLDFIRRNSLFLGRCYPSRTYFAIEEFSYVYDHLEDFGIKTNPPNHLFWESTDGANTYPLRMERCRRFCELALSLGVEVGAGVQTSVLQDEWFNLANYYEMQKEHNLAVENLFKYYQCDQDSSVVNNKILFYKEQLDSGLIQLPDNAVKKLRDICSDMQNHKNISSDIITTIKLKGKPSWAYIKTKFKNLISLVSDDSRIQSSKNPIYDIATKFTGIMEQNNGFDNREVVQEYLQGVGILSKKNSMFNDLEFQEKAINLFSSPKAIFLQFAGPCNSSCVFCSRGHDYAHFKLEHFKSQIELPLKSNLVLAEQFILTGSGEFLRLPEWREILNHLEEQYPHVEKMFSTNGSSLCYEAIDLLALHKSRYSIHASLHSSNPDTHKIMTRMDNFDIIIDQIKYLIERRKQHRNIRIDLFFVATTLNIEDLPNFVRLAKNLGVDSVIVNYNYIYVPAQKYLSCYFKPETTNMIFDEAQALAGDLGIPLSLPPKFGQSEYPALGICRELWSQIMFNDKGHVLPCDASGDCDLRLGDGKSFFEIWNSQFYREKRKELVEKGHTDCFDHCHRANPCCINTFSSHVIHRGRENQNIDVCWEDNF